ncbi:MAG: hypothetical protein IJT75_02770 [Bacteroidaceae bacterium]|nr:hypothetical protein [Bacteroidaceae bacterium]
MSRHFTRALVFPVFLCLSCITAVAQNVTAQRPTTVDAWADRLTRFGKAIPQEKVYVHLDNTCYFLGDTIWYAAYTRRTDKDIPSNVSRVLYAELYNQDGYLVERQLVEMKNGRGHGQFALPDTLYGGYYELRAYTRWQLNWGQTLHPYTKYAEEWFFNRTMAREYYRDYEKLYSRVFPVYDKPKQPGEFFHDMTTRPLRRNYGEDKSQQELRLTLYPEGGSLVAGVPCRVAFEACSVEGEWQEGKLLPPSSLSGKGQIPDEGVPTLNRGRGVFTFTPEAGEVYEFTFTDQKGRTAKARLPKVETDGVALHVEQKGEEWDIQIAATGAAAAKPLGLTVMHEGKVEFFECIVHSAEVHSDTSVDGKPESQQSLCTMHSSTMHLKDTLHSTSRSPGIRQATVFDADGRVWADRLFFVMPPTPAQPTVTISGQQQQYNPFEEVTLSVQCPATVSQGISLSVRDAARQDYLYDSGNILTEMLLSSEIKGFVPQPEYFFEADDEEHRTALDLLMMTQGWRRFSWQTMATPGLFAIQHPAEYTQVLSGIVNNYTAENKENEFQRINDRATAQWMVEKEREMGASDDALEGIAQSWGFSLQELTDEKATSQTEDGDQQSGDFGGQQAYDDAVNRSKQDIVRKTQYRTDGRMAASRFFESEGNLKREVLVHAEFVQPGSPQGVEGDAITQKGCFRMQVPDFQGQCILYLAASDTTKWKEGKPHTWISMDEEEFPEFYVRLAFPYPRFVKPYTYYQTLPAPTPEGSVQDQDFQSDDATLMNTVTVRSRRKGLRAFDASKPAFVLDAYTAFNETADAGLNTGRYQGHTRFVSDIARTYIGDMNMQRAYAIEARYNTRNSSFYHSPTVMEAYNELSNLDKVYVYTDYSPRREGSSLFDQSNQPSVTVDLRRPADEGRRVTYRDRRYILDGFVITEDFYHPNYQLSPAATPPADYRRTLYWNPDLQLDANGQATVRFFTGSRPVSLDVDANGQAADGTLLTN